MVSTRGSRRLYDILTEKPSKDDIGGSTHRANLAILYATVRMVSREMIDTAEIKQLVFFGSVLMTMISDSRVFV